jgi:hypothetical protein
MPRQPTLLTLLSNRPADSERLEALRELVLSRVCASAPLQLQDVADVLGIQRRHVSEYMAVGNRESVRNTEKL